MTLNFVLVCDDVQQEAGKLNVSGVFDSVGSVAFPALHPSLAVVVNLEVPEAERNRQYVESFRITYAGNTVLEDTTSFTPTMPRHQFLHRIQDLVLQQAGRYDVEIFVGGNSVGKTYFLATQSG